jgi:RNA polymerase sigma-54 factor
MVTGEKVEDLHEAIAVIQQLEPAGVGARNLQERLLIQLRRNDKQDTLTYKAIELYLDDIAANRLPKVAKTMEITMTELHQVISEIQNLTPHLTDNMPVLPQNYVEEEVEIIEEHGVLAVKINDGRVPTLKISPYYKKMLKDPHLAKDAKEYIKSKINGGVFLINSLMQRQSTIHKITNAILSEQETFFKEGLNHLRPLTMSQVADLSGVHETTVSRAVSGKYLKCKYGLFPLRYFFTPGYTASNGSEVSNATVKKAIKELISKEDPRKPLSDSQLANLLKEQGLKVARRTVAKYRENLSILPSNLRRQY